MRGRQPVWFLSVQGPLPHIQSALPRLTFLGPRGRLANFWLSSLKLLGSPGPTEVLERGFPKFPPVRAVLARVRDGKWE